MARLFKVLTRKKILDSVSLTDTRLARVLNVYDLTALGIGSTLGIGVYVLAGQVAKETAGPSVVLSFLIAALASVFAGLCYAEFGSRVPRAGSAYIYSYVTVGELIAFIIGWNLILEYVIGSASVARGLSHYLDTLLNSTLENTFREIAPINVSFMSDYFDFFSFGLSVILATALAFGMKESSRVNNLFTILNVLVILFVIVAGSIKANPQNWNLPAPSNSTLGNGGFFPFGISGMIKGAATCFYGFVGFDCIATTGEEVLNPQTAIPLSIIASLTVTFLAYFGTSTVLTLMVPYYFQDSVAPIPHAFAEVGWEVAKWIVTIGAIFGLFTSLFGSMFPLPRVIYAMASDGVIFKFLGRISERFHTPIIGTLLAGLLTGLMSALFDLKQLVDMMSIGTLLAYTIVAVCVLSLRFANEQQGMYSLIPMESDIDDEYTDHDEMGNTINTESSIELIDPDEKVTFVNLLRQSFNFQRLQNPTKTSQFLVNVIISFYVLLCLALGLCIMYLQDDLRHGRVWAITLMSVIGLLMILLVMSMATQPNSRKELTFKVPLVPFIPALSILINIYLMIMLDVNTWIRFGAWMAVGLPIYLISIPKCTSNTNKMHAKINGVKSIGYLHNGGPDYTHDKNNITDSALSSSPTLTHAVNNSLYCSVDSLSVNGALAALDEMLSKEDGSVHRSVFSRKVSLDTVSNVSYVHCEESIVAIVHNEDACSNVSQIIPLQNTIVANDIKSDKLVPVIPPPPSMEEFEKFKIPRVDFKQHHSQDDMLLNNVKPKLNAALKMHRTFSQPEIVTRCPSPDYQLSRKSSTVEDIDDNIAFGSAQHKKIMGTLNKLFERRSVGLPEVKLTQPDFQKGEITMLPEPVPSPLKLTDENATSENSPELHESTNDNVLTPTDIKKKLDEIFRSDPRLKISPVKPSLDIISAETVELPKPSLLKTNGYINLNMFNQNGEADLKADINLHKNLMHNTLKSIKLRKTDSIST